LEEFCFDESLITNFEVRRRNPILICRTLVLFLRKSDGISEFCMELVEVSDVLVCMSRNKIIFWMDGDGRVIAFVGKERRNSGCSIWSIVISKLGQRKEQTPVILLIVGIHTEILLQGLVDSFGLTITFRVISGGEVQLHIKGLS